MHYPTDVQYLVFESNDGYQGNNLYLWNDLNSESEAGSPYKGIDYNNIDQLDTLRGSAIPEPTSGILFGLGLSGLAVHARARQRPVGRLHGTTTTRRQ